MVFKKSKCIMCKKKHLIIFKCECCNKSFCMDHRLPELHECKANFNNKDDLKERLQKIETSKIDKI